VRNFRGAIPGFLIREDFLREWYQHEAQGLCFLTRDFRGCIFGEIEESFRKEELGNGLSHEKNVREEKVHCLILFSQNSL
jgi:hypothetical protein